MCDFGAISSQLLCVIIILYCVAQVGQWKSVCGNFLAPFCLLLAGGLSLSARLLQMRNKVGGARRRFPLWEWTQKPAKRQPSCHFDLANETCSLAILASIRVQVQFVGFAAVHSVIPAGWHALTQLHLSSRMEKCMCACERVCELASQFPISRQLTPPFPPSAGSICSQANESTPHRPTKTIPIAQRAARPQSNDCSGGSN